MADSLITWDEKELYQDRPAIPENKKFTYSNANELKEVVNTNALKLPFLMKANGSSILTGIQLEGIDVGTIKGMNTFLAKDEDFKKEISDDTIYDMDGITPLASFISGKTYELTPNNTK